MRIDVEIEAIISLEVPENTTSEEQAEIVQNALSSMKGKSIMDKAEVVDTALNKICEY